MDCKLFGEQLTELRKEKGYTQKQLAQELNVSDKAVSKWECGYCCPDISLLGALSTLLNVNLEAILQGHLVTNTAVNGNMRKSKVYYCPLCGNVLVSLSQADIACCGRKLYPMEAQPADEAHRPQVEKVEDEWYVTASHPMTKEHYVSVVFCLSGDKLQETKLYSEQDLQVRFKRQGPARLYLLCNQHGLYYVNI